MTATQLILELTKYVREYGDLELVYAKDEDGNSYHLITYEPTVGALVENDFDYEPTKVTHVLIN